MQTKTLSLPKLNGLNPTLESTALKLMEEAGELAQCIGKFRGMSGENTLMDKADVLCEISKELMDVAQVAVTMMFVMEEQHGIYTDEILQEHIEKMERKGYLRKGSE